MQEVLGTDIAAVPADPGVLRNFPLYISENYRAYSASLFNHDFLLVELKNEQAFSIAQIEKHLHILRDSFNQSIVLLCNDITAITRKRLIEKGINFIAPGKQLYLPDFFIDLRERFQNARAIHKTEKLLPSAQFVLLYHILHYNKDQKTDELSFKDLAKKFGYTQTAITKAVENLKHFELCNVEGSKEKFIHFNEPINELWHSAEPYLINPVLKRVFVDERPMNHFMLSSNASALPEYSKMNPSRQEYYAIEKTSFYSLVKNKQLINPNDHEGNFCLEVWKYDPSVLVDDLPNDLPVVDPLSLYLSLKDSHDERIENALDEIIKNNISIHGNWVG